MSAMSYDALIIGGGPAGSTAALMLARAGWKVALVEKSVFPRRKVCGEFISATSLPLLLDLGIGEAYREQAGPEVRALALFARETVLRAPMPRLSHGEVGFGRALGREHLDRLLLEAARRAGAEIWQPWTVSDVRREGEALVGMLSAKGGTKALAARIVVAAHGSWERSGLPLLPARAMGPGDLLAFKAHFRDDALAPGVMPLVVFPGGYGGLVHTDEGRLTLSCCVRRDVLRKARERSKGGKAAEAVLHHILTHCAGARAALKGARREGAWLSAGPIRPGIRKRYAHGIFFAGNSAGEAHPIVAEGISMAMQSAWLLSRHLIATQDRVFRADAQAAAGRAYAREWARLFAPRLHAAAAFAELAMRPTATAAVLPLFKRFPDLLTFGAQLSGKTLEIMPAH